jgi:hypothetical protein
VIVNADADAAVEELAELVEAVTGERPRG